MASRDLAFALGGATVGALFVQFLEASRLRRELSEAKLVALNTIQRYSRECSIGFQRPLGENSLDPSVAVISCARTRAIFKLYPP